MTFSVFSVLFVVFFLLIGLLLGHFLALVFFLFHCLNVFLTFLGKKLLGCVEGDTFASSKRQDNQKEKYKSKIKRK